MLELVIRNVHKRYGLSCCSYYTRQSRGRESLLGLGFWEHSGTLWNTGVGG